MGKGNSSSCVPSSKDFAAAAKHVQQLQLPSKCTSNHNCGCSLVPSAIWDLECQAEKEQHQAAAQRLQLASILAKLAALLLRGGHSARAFRRTTDAFQR